MVLRSIEAFLQRTPLVLSLGGALMVYVHALRMEATWVHCLESFLLVCLGYRAFQDSSLQRFKYEKGVLLTILLLCFFWIGFPPSILLAGGITWLYMQREPLHLRNIPIVKNLSIALAWTCCTAALVLSPSSENLPYFFADFMLVFGLSLLSDLRDKSSDRRTIRTIAHLVNPWVIGGWCLVGMLCYHYLHYPQLTPSQWLVWLATSAYIILLTKYIHHLSYSRSTLLIDSGIIWMTTLHLLQSAW